MKGPRFYLRDYFFREMALKTSDHLSCCLIGKSKEQNTGRVYTTMQKVCDTPYYGGSFTCPCTRDDKVMS